MFVAILRIVYSLFTIIRAISAQDLYSQMQGLFSLCKMLRQF